MSAVSRPSYNVKPAVKPAVTAAAPMPDSAGLAAALRQAFPHLEQQLPASEPQSASQPSVAVVVPCYNEAGTIGGVIAAFRATLPDARIIVFDNRSSDGTADVARNAGAEVMYEPRPGKGNVVRRMFADIDADVYLMVDGDGTYDAASAPKLVAMIVEQRLDMAIGARANIEQDAHRSGHAVGNRIFNGIYRSLFGADYGDIFSGYRAFSRRFVKSFPALSSGFEIETELAVHASQLKLPAAEIATPYGARPEGSTSKLRSVHDGLRILRTFAYLLKETRPAFFFGMLASGLALVSVVLAVPLAETWLATGLVPRLPTAILCTGLILLSGLMMTCGLILDSLARSRVEQKRILYLAVSSLGDRRQSARF